MGCRLCGLAGVWAVHYRTLTRARGCGILCVRAVVSGPAVTTPVTLLRKVMMMSDYAWVITRDVLENRPVTILGPRISSYWIDGETKADTARRLRGEEGRQRFQLLDCDGEVYYEGYLVGGDGMEPLDDYGTPAAGCTDIRFIRLTAITEDGTHPATL